MSNLIDKFGRKINYIRISVTDRCNFRCRYCMPSNTYEHMQCSQIMTYEELLYTASVLADYGIEKIRVTGGEPLVRKDIVYFLSELTKIKGIKETSLTTNGTTLPFMAQDIFNAGIKRINISLDSLKADRYKYITGGFNIEKVMKGIDAAKKVGFNPIKINTVVIKGFNDDEIIDFCEFSAKERLDVRFIEFMPIGNSPDWHYKDIMTGKEILELIQTKYKVENASKETLSGPARNYIVSNGAKIGIITPMSEHFCDSCDKIRLTADGKIRPCLLSDKEVSIMEAVNAKNSKMLMQIISDSLRLKKESHDINDQTEKFKRIMYKIGG